VLISLVLWLVLHPLQRTSSNLIGFDRQRNSAPVILIYSNTQLLDSRAPLDLMSLETQLHPSDQGFDSLHKKYERSITPASL
jgi:hypothetical protein